MFAVGCIRQATFFTETHFSFPDLTGRTSCCRGVPRCSSTSASDSSGTLNNWWIAGSKPALSPVAVPRRLGPFGDSPKYSDESCMYFSHRELKSKSFHTSANGKIYSTVADMWLIAFISPSYAVWFGGSLLASLVRLSFLQLLPELIFA